MESSKYIEQERRLYSLYVMQNRALPAVTDGLKAGGRRVLWIGRNGEKTKTATLAGATLPIHPHATPEGSINTLAAPYGNNIPLFKGYGAFGTMLDPTAYGAARYTSVATSKFTEDVMFKDIEIIPMVPNYDDTLEEPVHFLPLVPVAMLNPSEGIAVGFASNILPRDLADIIEVQLAHLQGKKTKNELVPFFKPIDNRASKVDGRAFFFDGEYEEINATTIRITKMPYGQAHDKVVAKLDDLCESGTIVDYTDRSKDVINIEVKFKKGVLSKMDRAATLKLLALSIKHNENLNVLDFTGQGVWSAEPLDLVCKFTDWRLLYYPKRYQRLLDLLNIDIQRYNDIILAIDKDVGHYAREVASRAELVDLLTAIGIVDTQYIASMPIYRFTQDEYDKAKTALAEALKTQQTYTDIISSIPLQKQIYAQELQEVLSKYKKGTYA